MCVIFIKQGVPFRVLELGVELEYIVVEVWEEGREVVVVNFYNPCKRLELEKLLVVKGKDRRRVVWCGDFNAHSTLWGGSQTDVNGATIEELMKESVCLND